MMKVYVNQSGVSEGSTAVVEHHDKDQVAGLELAESFILCEHQAFKTHIKNIAVFIHKDDRMKVCLWGEKHTHMVYPANLQYSYNGILIYG
jgi:hypothetical protein